MIKKIIRLSFIPLIIVGTILTTIILQQDVNFSVIQVRNVQYGDYTWTYYYFDVQLYITNVKNAVLYEGITFNAVFPQPPQFPQILSGSSYHLGDLTKSILNCFVWEGNFFIWLINLTIILPVKILIYPINVILTLLGMDTSPTEWIQAVKQISQATINYLNYLT